MDINTATATTTTFRELARREAAIWAAKLAPGTCARHPEHVRHEDGLCVVCELEMASFVDVQ
jgi:hypothetical protein